LVEDHVVQRNRHTKTQTGLSIEQRQANLASVFSVSYHSKIQDRDLILVDDVFTTGATTYELASALRLAGAANMVVLTLAMA
jgi:predicted amidophosphoribosyltransferase